MNQLVTSSHGHKELILKLDVERLDMTVADQVKANLKAAADASSDLVVIDMDQVTFVDSSGLSVLVSLRKHLGAERSLRLKNTAPFVEKALRLTHLDKVFGLAN